MTGKGPLRRAGSPWRVLVHECLGAKGRDSVKYGEAFDVSNNPAAAARQSEGLAVTVLEGTEFDELAVGSWTHLEQMDTGIWHCAIGGVVIIVTADRDGRPKRVAVSGLGDYDGLVEGCTYVLDWSARPGT